jgi:hypothetical protein
MNEKDLSLDCAVKIADFHYRGDYDEYLNVKAASKIIKEEIVNVMQKEIDLLKAQNKIMHDLLIKISKQVPEKPDHWCSCGQCENNSYFAEEAIEEIEKMKS